MQRVTQKGGEVGLICGHHPGHPPTPPHAGGPVRPTIYTTLHYFFKYIISTPPPPQGLRPFEFGLI